MTIRTEWRAIAILFLFNGLLYGAWAVRIPALTQKHDIDTAMLGLLLLALSVGAILSFPLAGKWSDRFGAVYVSKLLVWFYPITIAAVGFAPTLVWLALALFAVGIVHGALDVAMNAWAADYEKRKAAARMMAFHAMWSLGGALGAATGFLAIFLGLSVGMHFLAIGVIATVITVYLVAPAWPETPTNGGASATGFVWPKGILLGLGIASMCATIGEGAMADWSTLFLIRVNGVSEANAVVGFALYSVVMICMRLIGDQLIVQTGAPRLAALSGISAFIGAVIVALSPTFVISCIGFIFLAFGYAMVFPMAVTAAAAKDSDNAAGNIAAVAIFAYGGTLVGPPVLGFIAALSNLRFSFGTLAVLALCLLAMSPVFRGANPQAKQGS